MSSGAAAPVNVAVQHFGRRKRLDPAATLSAAVAWLTVETGTALTVKAARR